MEEALITKKELLELTGISYGALYRWKRKNLIPDEWFIHRATFTGQETFFPRDRILDRIERIKRLKDGMSLDDIAESFSPSIREVAMSPSEAEIRGVAPRNAIDLYIQAKGSGGPFDFPAVFELYLFARLLRSGELGRDDAWSALAPAAEALRLKKEESVRLIVYRKLGVAFGLLVDDSGTLIADREARKILEIPIGNLVSELKQVLNHNEA